MKDRIIDIVGAAICTFIIFIGAFIIWVSIVMITNTSDKDDGEFYYYQAEIIAQSDGIVTFGGVDVENPQIYVYNAGKELDCDVPYLLTMDNMRTDDVSDDIVVVVWACVN